MEKRNLILATIGVLALLWIVHSWDESHKWKEHGDPGILDRINPDRTDWRLKKRDTSSSNKQEAEALALNHFTNILYEFSKPQASMDRLIEILSSNDLSPKVTENTNPYTGNMYTVRTNYALPGTRYFHAQYFSNEGETPFIQHMSFEFRPGDMAMKEAVEALRKSFGNLGKPVQQKQDFLEWRWREDYILWVRRLNQEDLKGHPINAYSPDDVGTIQVALELDLTGDHGHHH